MKRIPIYILWFTVTLNACKSNQAGTTVLAHDEYKIWKLLDAKSVLVNVDSTTMPTEYQLLELNMVRTKNRFKEIEPYVLGPNQVRFDDPTKQELYFQLPWDNGSFQTYVMQNSSMLTPDLAKKFPNIRAYSGYRKTNPAIQVRVDINPKGFFAMITAPQATVYIKPYDKDKNLYLCYNKNNAQHLNKEFYEPPIKPPPDQ